MTETATVYKDRDNFFTLEIQKDDVTLTESEMQDITKFEIRYQDEYYDSTTYASSFVTDDANGKVTIYPYEFDLDTSFSTGDLVELLIYTSTYTHGIMWAQFRLVVKGDAELIS